VHIKIHLQSHGGYIVLKTLDYKIEMSKRAKNDTIQKLVAEIKRRLKNPRDSPI
jgi:hypothetical protein